MKDKKVAESTAIAVCLCLIGVLIVFRDLFLVWLG